MELEKINVTGAKLNQFEKKGIVSVETLLSFLPSNYKDYRDFTGLRTDPDYSVVLVDIQTCSYKPLVPGNKTDVLRASGIEVSTGARVIAVWFRQQWRYSQVNASVRHRVLICGKFKYDPDYKTYTVTPDVYTMNIEQGLAIYPEYKKIAGMSYEYLTEKIDLALSTDAARTEVLPERILRNYNLVPMADTYKFIHSPHNDEEIAAGENRIKYNDLVYFALRREYASREAMYGSSYTVKNMTLFKKVLASFPYELTSDQASVVDNMLNQVKHRHRLHTLIQGDVGSGKTICALLMAAAFVGSGYQAAILAPTQVLAEQHYADAVNLFEPFGYKVIMLNSKMKAKEKKAALKSIREGESAIIIGTHSIFAKDVMYKNLAITVADEEHKFGVAQRAALVAKAAEGCHSITMSATPIPRTIAQSIYGDDIDLQEIKHKPAGRIPVKTVVCSERLKIYKSLERQLVMGHQAYVVCPMIDKSEKVPGLLSVEETYEEYKKAFEGKGYKVAMLTGKTSETDTSRILGEFKSGEIQILVSTTVIEVGVNVPNATVIIITNAERFGLSGLHQLRGRVGRGKYPSFCVLEYIIKSDKATQRLNALCSSNDGYEIAIEDLKQRGPGDLIGTQQSGENKYISLMLMYPDDYNTARQIASEMLDMDYDCCRMLKDFKDEISS